MMRWIVFLAVAALSGCAVYDDGYYGRGYDRGYDDVYVDGRSYYSPGYADDGDYYYGTTRVDQVGYDYPLWVDYPAYYSLFWPWQYQFVDPFWNPRFYYGVTFFPRNYFSVSLYGGYHWPYYSGYYRHSLWYSPYRYAWVDHYYDWYPYYRQHDRYRYDEHWYAPRYGTARNEAERLSQLSQLGPNRYRALSSDGLPQSRWQGGDRYGRADRGADYSGRSPRLDPGVRGFDRPTADRRGPDYGQRGSDRRAPPVDRLDGGEQPIRRGDGRGDPRFDRAPVAGRAPPSRGAEYGDDVQVERRPSRDRGALIAPPPRGEPDDRVVVERVDGRRGDRGYTLRSRPPQQGYALPSAPVRPRSDYSRTSAYAPPERRGSIEPGYRAAPRAEAPAYRPAPSYRDAPTYRDAPNYRQAPPVVRDAPPSYAPARGRVDAPAVDRSYQRSAPEPSRPEPPSRSEPPSRGASYGRDDGGGRRGDDDGRRR